MDTAGGLLVDANGVPHGVALAFRVRDDDYGILPGTSWFGPTGTSRDIVHEVHLPRPGADNSSRSRALYSLRLDFTAE